MVADPGPPLGSFTVVGRMVANRTNTIFSGTNYKLQSVRVISILLRMGIELTTLDWKGTLHCNMPCATGKRESRHHLFTECEAWRPQIRRLWRRIGKDCGWKHPRAPAVRKLWRKEATEAVLEFLEDTRVGCWTVTQGARRPAEGVGQGGEGEEGGPGPP